MFAKCVHKLPIWLLAIILIGLTPIACATDEASNQENPKQEEKKAAESSGEKEAEAEVKVYTNADLEKMFGEESEEEVEPTALPPMPPAAEPAKTTTPSTESKPGDPLALMQQQQALKEERGRSIAEAEKAVADARARVKDLEERIMALKNPYRARPVIPDDEREAWGAMGTRQRLEDSEEKLRQAREDLAEAEKKLARIR